MGILDNVFAGNNGVFKTLANTLGGTATIEFITQGIYNERTDSYNQTSTSQVVSFMCESASVKQKTAYPVSNGGFLMSGGLLYEANDLAGIIPYADLGQMPRTNQDKITYMHETYRITQTKILNVGNGHVGVAIVAKK